LIHPFVLKCTSGGYVCLNPLSQLFGVEGFLDLYVSEPWCWGFELLRDGEGINEHFNRFLEGGRYFKMRERGQLKQMVLLDMRSDTTGAPRSFTSSDSDVWVIRVCFCDSYTKAIVHGLGDQPVTLDVGLGESIGSRSVPGVHAPFRN